MIAFLRICKLLGVVAVLVVVAMAIAWVDRRLGTGHLLLGMFVGLIGTAGLVILFIVRQQQVARGLAAKQRAKLKDPPMPTEPMAFYEWKVTTLDGEPFDLEQVRRQTVFLNFWSTSCPPCLSELPSIQRLHDQLAGEGVVFLCVALDMEVEPVRDLLAQENLKLPVYVLGDQDLPPVFDSEYIPSTFMIAHDGRIAYHHQSAARWDHPRVLQFLRGLLMQDVVTSVRTVGTPDRSR